MKLRIQVLLNAAHTNTLQHPPIVSLDDGMPQPAGCSTSELLDYLKSAGVSENEISEAVREIEQKGQTVLESRSEEHTSELQSLRHLVCRLLLEKKKRHTICT